MHSADAVLIEFTDSNPPRVKSHRNWEEVYRFISQLHNSHPDPYFLQSGIKAVTLVDDGDGNVKASLSTAEQAEALYDIFGGVWVQLVDDPE